MKQPIRLVGTIPEEIALAGADTPLVEVLFLISACWPPVAR